jgi:hypothetical protein
MRGKKVDRLHGKDILGVDRMMISTSVLHFCTWSHCWPLGYAVALRSCWSVLVCARLKGGTRGNSGLPGAAEPGVLLFWRTLGVKLVGSVSAKFHTAVRPERRDVTSWLAQPETAQTLGFLKSLSDLQVSSPSHNCVMESLDRSASFTKRNKCTREMPEERHVITSSLSFASCYMAAQSKIVTSFNFISLYSGNYTYNLS